MTLLEENPFSQTSTNTLADISAAVESAYDAIAQKGNDPAEVHKMAVCSEASALIVDSLLAQDKRAEQEVTLTEGVGQHAFPVIRDEEMNEIVIDPAWQQFLPAHKRTDDLPRFLVGSRSEVIESARRFGVKPQALKVWEANSSKPTISARQAGDIEAEEATKNTSYPIGKFVPVGQARIKAPQAKQQA